jgi:hypothetical protein
VAKLDRIILCGGTPAPRRAKEDQILRLDLGGDNRNVDLEIIDISRRLSSDVPDVLTDLVEIASYVYCADQAITRGDKDSLNFGNRWRRPFQFHIPVRLPAFWSAKETTEVLQKTLSLLSEDTYSFIFLKQSKAAPMQQYLKFEGEEPGSKELDEVLLFSGGVDSLGGAVQEAVSDKRRVGLVSHRSNSKIFSRQKKVVDGLRAKCASSPPLYVPVWVHQRGASGREYTQRTRTFLYSSLAFTVARVFGLNRVRFYENGVVSLNLPISEQVVGARATRTTHPQVLTGFGELFSLIAQGPFSVENPFLWKTKTEIFDLIGDAGCEHLIQDSVSCMHTMQQTRDQPHCGRCSQCISRRFAALASRYAASDPGGQYQVDLLTGPRLPEKDLTLVESFIRTATDIGSMNEFQLVEHYGEVSRIVRHLQPLTSNQAAEKILELYRRHSSDVTKVMDEAIRAHASEIREGRLPKTCAIILAVPETYKGTTATMAKVAKPARDGVPQKAPMSSGDGNRGPGRRADAEGNRRIASIIQQFGPDWRKHLPKVCETLDKKKVPLTRSKKWKTKGCSDWTDVLADDPEGLVKALQHRLDWAAEHPANESPRPRS